MASDGNVSLPPRRRRLAFALVTYAFIIVMLGTTMPTLLYSICQQRLGFSELMVTVIFATYAAGVIAALIVFGSWADQLGRRPVLLGPSSVSPNLVANLPRRGFYNCWSAGRVSSRRLLWPTRWPGSSGP